MIRYENASIPLSSHFPVTVLSFLAQFRSVCPFLGRFDDADLASEACKCSRLFASIFRIASAASRKPLLTCLGCLNHTVWSPMSTHQSLLVSKDSPQLTLVSYFQLDSVLDAELAWHLP